MDWIKKLGLLTLAIIVLAVGWIMSRPSMDEVGIAYAQPAAPDSKGLTVKWFGISTLLIDDGETQLLTDGFFSRPSLLDIVLKRPIAPEIETITRVLTEQKMDRLAAVIPVHSHYDHAMDSAEIAKQTNALVLGSTSTAMAARSSGLQDNKIQIVNKNQAYYFGQFKVTFFESRHAPLPTNAGIDGTIDEVFALPAPYTAWQLGEAYSILIEHPKGDLLVQGSAGHVPGALKGLDVDAVFLGTGGLHNQLYEYQQAYIFETVTQTNPSVVYTIHHDNLFGALGNVEQSRLIPEYDEIQAFEMGQLISPSRFEQMRYAQAIEIITKTATD
jgi:L-ascorbate metabolism protein UlaG (beta-lactamase superfamily)